MGAGVGRSWCCFSGDEAGVASRGGKEGKVERGPGGCGVAGEGAGGKQPRIGWGQELCGDMGLPGSAERSHLLAYFCS